MSTPDADILAVAREGNKIEAIKLYRERYDCGLAEAKEAVEAMLVGLTPQPPGLVVPPPAAVSSTALDLQIVGLLRDDQKIQAIKLYRERTGLGLKEAKEAVERIGAQHGIVPPAATSRCFVATAAYGSALAPEVDALRTFRDEVLGASRGGRLAVRIYYRVSPPIAARIARSATARRVVRAALEPIVRLVGRR